MVRYFLFMVSMLSSCSVSSPANVRYEGIEISPIVYRETEQELGRKRKEKDIPRRLTFLERTIKERSEVSSEAAACYRNYPLSIFLLTSKCCDKKPYHCDTQYGQYLKQKESQLNHQLDFIDAHCANDSHAQELVCDPSYRQHLEEKLDSLQDFFPLPNFQPCPSPDNCFKSSH